MNKSFRTLPILFFLGFFIVVAAHAQQRWIGSWSASPMAIEPGNVIPSADGKDVILREIVHLSVGGPELRLHLSNRFGSAPLHIASVHIARAVASDSPRIVAGSDRPLSFDGHQDVAIPAGADYISDPVHFSAAPLSGLAITIEIPSVPTDQTGHSMSNQTSYLVHGGQLSAEDLQQPKTLVHWYFIDAIDVAAPAMARSVVAFGDSITDGWRATVNGNDNWPDDLAKRLQDDAKIGTVAVLNQGISGNRLLLNGTGPNALSRFDHDVIAQNGVRYLVVLEGINDIGMLNRLSVASPAENKELVDNIIAAYKQIIARAHTHGIKVIGGTLTPFVGSDFYHPGPEGEGDRQAVNKWIRTSGKFDAVVDFDRVVRDPKNPERMLPKFDSGDHLHPGPAGYAAMADAIPLSWFSAAKFGAAKVSMPKKTVPRRK